MKGVMQMPRQRKLTPIEERIIYTQRKQGVPLTELAYKNGVSVKTVERTCQRVEKESEVQKNERPRKGN